MDSACFHDVMIVLIVGVLAFTFGYLAGVLPPRKAAGRFAYKVLQPQSKGAIPMLELTCTNEEKIKVSVTPVTSTGKPAQIDESSLVVEVISGDGFVQFVDDTTFYVVSGDNPGDTQYLVKADADLGDGIVEISDIVALRVTGALAANLGLSAAAPEPK